MVMRRVIPCCFFSILSACGGSPSTQQAVRPTPPSIAKPKPSSTNAPPCTRPIETPKAVWQRLEEARALSETDLAGSCGLAFVEVLSDWRTTPVDLLRPIVRDARKNGRSLTDWVKERATDKPRAALSVAAMDILGDWQIGDETIGVEQRASMWKPLISTSSCLAAIGEDLPKLIPLLNSLKEIHELRCRLEVNPLGFAVSCTPIHPAKEKIDLTWQEEIQDGLIRNLSLSKCKESRFCPKLQETSRLFFAKYRAALTEAERLKTDVFKDQVLEWLKLKPFSQGTK